MMERAAAPGKSGPSARRGFGGPPRWGTLPTMSLIRRNFAPVRIYLPAPPAADDPACDVALIQGFFTTPAALDPLRDRLEAAGLSCGTPALGGLRGQYQTARLRASGEALARWLAARPADRPPPWIVAHSLGGLIARDAVQRHGARIAGLITLGTPHRGTPSAIAGLLLGPLTRTPLDLLPWLGAPRHLNRMPWPEALPLLSISGGADLLCPPPFGRLPLAGPAIRARHHRRMGHTELLRAPDVLDEITALLVGWTPVITSPEPPCPPAPPSARRDHPRSAR